MTQTALLNHLLQSTVFGGVAALVALALRGHRARVRHAVWMAASVKFLVPFALLGALGSHLAKPAVRPEAPPATWAIMAGAPQPFTAPSAIDPGPWTPPQAIHGHVSADAFLLGVWLCGFLALACRWLFRWSRMHAVLRAARLLETGVLPVMLTSAALEPGVFGIFRPVLLLPAGICERLSPEQLAAVRAHEECHVRRRDNLSATTHMLVEAIFWFYPLVWWLGQRLVEERERACDEALLEAGCDAEAYAEGIVRVCRFYAESRLVCVSGMAGGDLRRRVTAIMSGTVFPNLHLLQKVSLAAVGAVAVALPLAAGMTAAARVQATPQGKPQFEVVSVRLGDPHPTRGFLGGVRGSEWQAENASLQQLIDDAYELPWSQHNRIEGIPHPLDQTLFTIEATIPEGTTRLQIPLMLQAMLEDRFHLVMHQMTREMPAVTLAVALGGFKLKPDPECGMETAAAEAGLRGCGAMNQVFSGDTVTLTGHGVAWQTLVNYLAIYAQEIPVLDRTGLTGSYDFKLSWRSTSLRGAPRSEWDNIKQENSSDFEAALMKQLGLTLNLSRPTKQPVPIWMIDHVSMPTPN